MTKAKTLKIEQLEKRLALAEAPLLAIPWQCIEDTKQCDEFVAKHHAWLTFVEQAEREKE